MKSKSKAVITFWIYSFFFVSTSNSTNPFETKIIQNCQLDQPFSNFVNSSVQFILHYENIVGTGLRVHTESKHAKANQPVVIVVRQKKVGNIYPKNKKRNIEMIDVLKYFNLSNKRGSTFILF